MIDESYTNNKTTIHNVLKIFTYGDFNYIKWNLNWVKNWKNNIHKLHATFKVRYLSSCHTNYELVLPTHAPGSRCVGVLGAAWRYLEMNILWHLWGVHSIIKALLWWTSGRLHFSDNVSPWCLRGRPIVFYLRKLIGSHDTVKSQTFREAIIWIWRQ